MLRELTVQNLALIEDVHVELRPGFCAWTGETGAGKSLLLGAMQLLLGERASADMIRTGAEELRVTGRFELGRPELIRAVEGALAETIDDGQVILKRRVSRSGRGTASVNDHPCPVATLKRVGEVLIDIHGQRANHSLLQPQYQLQLLDAFGKLTALRSTYVEKAEAVRSLRRERAKLAEEREFRQRELSLLRFEREELTAAQLRAGELDELGRERDRLQNAQSLRGFTALGAASLYDDDGSVAEVVNRLVREAEEWADLDPRLKEVHERLANLAPEVQDIAETCRDLGDEFEADPNRLDEVEKRINALRHLEEKYKKPIDELADYLAGLADREQSLQQQEDDLAGLDGRIEVTFAELRDAAEKLSKKRKTVAKKLAKEALAHLADLGMPSAVLDARLAVEPLGGDFLTAEVPGDGIDELDLMLAANPGEPAAPLRKVASGGEMARTMLSLKTVLAAHDPVGTLVFDEIDANVGGRLGDILGEKLARLGRSHQVICVTHLPQVAAYARHQWTIRKQSAGKRTTTLIQHLGADNDRVEELASMLRGDSRGETTIKEADAMLAAARKKW